MCGAEIVWPVLPRGRGESSYALPLQSGHTNSSLGTFSMALSTLLEVIIPCCFKLATRFFLFSSKPGYNQNHFSSVEEAGLLTLSTLWIADSTLSFEKSCSSQRK